MLIRAIKAANFKKYIDLRITNIPKKVCIGIVGKNESGKSTIGDVITFALFGKVANSIDNSLVNCVNWDSESCEVEVTFQVVEEEYRVMRYLDCKGESKAALYKAQETVPFASGEEKVNREIQSLTRFDLTNFYYTFYLAQKEIDILLKKSKWNSKEIFHNMLEFSKFTRACEKVEYLEGTALKEKDLYSKELLLANRSLQEIEAKQDSEKSFLQEIEETKRSSVKKLLAKSKTRNKIMKSRKAS